MRNASVSRLITSFWNAAKGLMVEPGPQLLRFSKSNFKTLPLDQKIEEEAHDSILKGRCHAVRIGGIIENKYQVVGNLGYGLRSTVWLASEFG